MEINSELKIVAIGGGAPKTTAKPLIKFAFEKFGLTPGSKILLIPTARTSEVEVNEWLEETAEAMVSLGYTTDFLHKYNDYPDSANLADKIQSADALYIAGGDSLNMMTEWNRLGISDLLKKQASQGIPIGGVSAGAIAPMAFGHSDSMSYRVKSPDEKWEYIKVQALGLVPFFITPHYNSKMPPENKPRSKSFKKMVFDEFDENLEYYGINNYAALLVNNGEVSAIRSDDLQNVHKLFLRGGQIASGDLPIFTV